MLSGLESGPTELTGPAVSAKELKAGCGFAAVHQIFQFFTRFKVRNALSRNIHPSTGLRIAAHTRLTAARAEASEATDFNFVSSAKGADDTVQYRLDNHFRVFAR